VLIYVVLKTTDIQPSWISWAKYTGPLFSYLGMSIFTLFTSTSRRVANLQPTSKLFMGPNMCRTFTTYWGTPCIKHK